MTHDATMSLILSRVRERLGHHAFSLSAFAALNGVGSGEAIRILDRAEREGLVAGQAGYYQLTEEGLACTT